MLQLKKQMKNLKLKRLDYLINTIGGTNVKGNFFRVISKRDT